MQTIIRYLEKYKDTKYFLDELSRHPLNGEILETPAYDILRFKNGLLSAEGIPAVECSDGHIEYWKDGRPHNENGPAVFDPNGENEIWIEGEQKTEAYSAS